MKKRGYIFATLFLVSIISSCGEDNTKQSKEKDASIEKKEIINNAIDLSKEFHEEMEAAEEKMGKGGSPIHYTDLQKYLPRNVEGYNMEDPEGTTLSMEGFSVSSAEAEYTSENGDYIRVSIMDYNAAQSLFQMSTAMWNMGITIDSDQEYAKSFSLNDDVNGWETFDKKNSKATVIAGVGNRLMISVEANNQTNVDKVKEVLASMNFKSMKIVTNKTK